MTRKIICDRCQKKVVERYPKMVPTGPCHRQVMSSEVAERGTLVAEDLVPLVREGLLYATSMDGPAEYGKLLAGRCRDNFVCDHCDDPLTVGAFAWAWSVWTDRTPYSEWEHEFLSSANVTKVATKGDGSDE